MKRRRVHYLAFAPVPFLNACDADLVRSKLKSERPATCTEVFVDHPVLLGRGTIAIAMPAGTWAWDFARTDKERERKGLADMIEALKRSTGRRRFRLRDVIEHDGELFLRRAALIALASCRDVRAVMARAGLGLLDSLATGPSQLRHRRRRQHRPLHERKVVNGWRARGLGWTAVEDAELTRTFAIGSTECRRLSKGEWEVLLDVRLEGRRTKGSVIARLVRLRRHSSHEQTAPMSPLP